LLIGAVSASRYTIHITNNQYTPYFISVYQGDEVLWINKDDNLHSVTARDGSFGSAGLFQYQTFRYVFANAGRFHYHCNYFDLNGTVVVHEIPTAPRK
jgi:plastocyanin